MEQVARVSEALIGNVGRVIFGKRDVIEEAVVALLCAGHILFDDVPGVGKTMMARALARSMGGTFKRIQFTPDVLPSDVTGVSVFDQKQGSFRFMQGPVFANVVLADEINRAPPKTQASLLECMEEGQVTADGQTHQLPTPFLVMATENTIEYEGTYPLPEAQLDRFMMRLHVGYPDREHERQAVLQQQHQHPIHSVEAVVETPAVLGAQAALREVRVSQEAQDYILDIVAATRSHPQVYLGASPRASIALFRGSQALAAVRGQDWVAPEHIKRLAPSVIAHRLLVRPEARLAGLTARGVVDEILAGITVD